MKSSELIKQLLELDPEGNIEVCVGNVDIYFLSLEAAFWDGSLQVLSRDESKKPYYNITGGKYVRHGSKVVIHPVSISDVVRDNPDTAVVDYSELGEEWARRTVEHHDKIRQSARDLDKKIDQEHFVKWVQKKAEEMYPEHDIEEVKEVAESYYDQNFSPNDPLKKLEPKKDKDGNSWWPSVVERRESHWEDVVEVTFDGWWGLRKKESNA